MFFFYALLATMAYSLQGTLLASCFRRMDRLSVVAYRGLTLGLTMLPILWWVDSWDTAALLQAMPWLLGAVAMAAVANWCNANSFCYLPVGIATALGMSTTAIVSVLLGYCVFKESLQGEQMIFVGLILVGIVSLGAARSHDSGPIQYNVARGLLYCALFGLFMAAGYVLIGATSRQIHPFLAGYLWEFLIGVLVAVVAWGRGRLGGASLQRLSWRDLGIVLLYSAPTALGSAMYPLAVQQKGSFAVATAVLSTMMVFSTLLALVLYRERLTLLQWGLLVFVCLMVVGLRLSSPAEGETAPETSGDFRAAKPAAIVRARSARDSCLTLAPRLPIPRHVDGAVGP